MKTRITKGWRDGVLGIGKDVGIVIGRFQPFHKGHEYLIKEAVKENDYVIVLIGSAKKARDIKNPWTVEERAIMLNNIALYNDIRETQIRYAGIEDFYDDDKWLKQVQAKIRPYVTKEDNVTLYGYKKDDSSYYLELFPSWKFKETYNEKYDIDATTVREYLFHDTLIDDILPVGVLRYIKNWIRSEEFSQLKEEFKYIQEYKKKFKDLQYEPVFTTVDAVITYKGKVFIMERTAEPGNHLLCLPGGFINNNKKLIDNMIDIVENKTKIRITDKNWIKDVKVIDDPKRSLRGRIITHIFKVEIPTQYKLNIDGNFKGQWMDFDDIELYEDQFFEDHALILKSFIT